MNPIIQRALNEYPVAQPLCSKFWFDSYIEELYKYTTESWEFLRGDLAADTSHREAAYTNFVAWTAGIETSLYALTQSLIAGSLSQRESQRGVIAQVVDDLHFLDKIAYILALDQPGA